MLSRAAAIAGNYQFKISERIWFDRNKMSHFIEVEYSLNKLFEDHTILPGLCNQFF